MNDPPPFVMPAGAAPGYQPGTGGESPTPEGVTYYRLYCGFLAAADFIIVVISFVMMIEPSLKPTGLPKDLSNVIVGAFYLLIVGLHLLGCLLTLFSGRKPWVHTLGMVIVGLSLLSCCCMPFGLPVLIAWNKPDVKRYFAGG